MAKTAFQSPHEAVTSSCCHEILLTWTRHSAAFLSEDRNRQDQRLPPIRNMAGCVVKNCTGDLRLSFKNPLRYKNSTLSCTPQYKNTLI